MGVEITTSHPHLFQGTILAGGTLTGEIDLGDVSLVGLMATTVPTNGTLNFQVSAFSDDNGQARGYYVDLYDDAGAAIAVTAPSARFGVSALVMAKLAGFRYVKIKSSPAQTNGLEIRLAGRP